MVDANQTLDLELIAEVREGGEAAREALIQKYSPMVRHIASKHYASFLEFDDLMQEGMIGLLGAIGEYKPEAFAVKFSSFAYLCIIRKVYNAIKHARGNKHRALNEAVSLSQSAPREEPGRTLLECLPARAGTASLPDPEEEAVARCSGHRLDAVLRAHLSLLEYSVIVRMLAGLSVREIQRDLGVDPKAIDNARTRIKTKLRRLVETYGALTAPSVPLSARRRRDLYVEIKSEGAPPPPYLSVEVQG